MKTRIQIIFFLVVIFVGSILILYLVPIPTHYSLEIQGMKDTYFVGEQYSFYYTLSGFGNTCGSWLVMFPDSNGYVKHRGEVIDCTSSKNQEISYDSRSDSRLFTSVVPYVEGTYNVTVSVEKVKETAVHQFTVSSKDPENDKRRIGWTPAFEYHRVQINGTSAVQICSMLKIMCPENPVFDAINRHDKNYTYFYYDLPNKDYLVVVDDGQICYITDDVDFENTGAFEKCIGIKENE